MAAFPTSVRPLFLEAGWHPGRLCALDERVPANHPAGDILRDFVGLRVGSTGRGEECARSDVTFRYIAEPDDQISAWEKLLQTKMIAFAESSQGYCELHTDEKGRVFSTNTVADGVYLMGWTFGEAMERLLLGRIAAPMLLPGQASVPLMGEDLKEGDPRILTSDHFNDVGQRRH